MNHSDLFCSKGFRGVFTADESLLWTLQVSLSWTTSRVRGNEQAHVTLGPSQDPAALKDSFIETLIARDITREVRECPVVQAAVELSKEGLSSKQTSLRKREGSP
jgi:hypothetical protein